MAAQITIEQARERLILALDLDSLAEAQQLVSEVNEYVGTIKIGLQLFCQEGPAAFDVLSREGMEIFFDGKFHDIPNTVAQATRAISKHGVKMISIHASAGQKVLEAAAKANREAAEEWNVPRPSLLAVTVLTSMSERMLNEELRVAHRVQDQVTHLARLARDSGIDGIVASPEEASDLRAALGPDVLIVTPGVRPRWADANDQSRILTPGEAIRNGSSHLVIGRPISQAPDRRDAARRIAEEVQQALAEL